MVVRKNRAKRPVISLFSGAMGLDLGLERAGFQVVVAVECNPYAVATIRKNRPNLPVIERRIETVTTAEILKAAGLKRGEAFVVAGGPSCQVFSTAGKRGSLNDTRGTLFEHFIRVVREARPRFFVMENVRGLLSAAVSHRPLIERGPGNPGLEPDEEHGSAFQVVARQLSQLGYRSVFDVLNAADFGVPQERHRLVIMGTRDLEPIAMPEPTHSRTGAEGLPRWRTLRNAIGGLKKKENKDYYRFCPSKEKYLALVPEGGNWRDLPAKMQQKAMGKAFISWGGRCGFFRRLAWDKPSPALTTRPDSKATSLCHPTELRPLTVEEYACIQQFPKDWEFAGMVRKKYEQVGNAVPLGLGEAVGRALLKAACKRKKVGAKGLVECYNIELLVSLCKRPKTIVNPPRMRDDTPDSTISEWYNGSKRHRDDAFDYAPEELIEELRSRVNGQRWRASARRISSSQQHYGLKPKPAGSKASRRASRLAAAE